ncbi:MAG: response regulator [Magnetococcales bacterium]|nr:response regulator [Magnetococcales bacterium]
MSIKEDYLHEPILIIDDEHANIRLLEDILHSNGYSSLRCCQDPAEAIELFAQNDFSLVLLDIMMPAIDGFEVLKRFAKIKPLEEVQVLVITALNDREVRLRALREGAADFLTKPIDEEEVLVRVSNQAQSAYLKNHLQDLVLKGTKEVERTKLEVLERLGRAAEYRDNETGMHVQRMANFSAIIARECGLSGAQCNLLLQSAPMHDIGKIGIPDNILLKPGKLDRDEWQIMQTHTDIGNEILSGGDTELLKMARSVAACHHEKWDGSGYPLGLKGVDIPLIGRIVAVADVFDALTSSRPYKSAWSVENAVIELEKCAGTQFDPEIVDAFKRVLPQILEIKDRYSN